MKRPLRSLLQNILLAACALTLSLTGFDFLAQAQDTGDGRTVHSGHAGLQQKRRRVRRRARTARRPARRVTRESVDTTTTTPQIVGVIRGSADDVHGSGTGVPVGPSSDGAPANAPTPTEPKTQRAPIRGGILNGRALNLPRPPYPAIAKAARASGTVVVEVIVDEEGKVISARAVSGHPLLQQAALQAAYGARFAPTRLSGQPVKVMGTISYNFIM